MSAVSNWTNKSSNYSRYITPLFAEKRKLLLSTWRLSFTAYPTILKGMSSWISWRTDGYFWHLQNPDFALNKAFLFYSFILENSFFSFTSTSKKFLNLSRYSFTGKKKLRHVVKKFRNSNFISPISLVKINNVEISCHKYSFYTHHLYLKTNTCHICTEPSMSV